MVEIGAGLDESDDEEVASSPGISTPVLLMGAVAVGVLGASCLAGGFVLLQPILTAPGADEYAVATRTLSAGEKIKTSDVAFTEGIVIPGAVNDPEKLIGRVAADVIYAGDPVIEPRLAPEGRPAGAAGLTPTGLRSIWFTNDAGIAGLGLGAGDRVDIWSVGRTVDDSALIAESIEVLAVETRPVSGDKFTLAVTPEQSDAIGQTRDRGTPLGMTLYPLVDRVDGAPAATALEIGTPADAAVVHAIRPLIAGEAIAADALGLMPDSGHGKRQFESIDDVVGRVPTRTIYPGERPIEPVLSSAAEGRGLAMQLASGERAVSLSLAGNPVEDFSPGVKVDVFGVSEPGVAEILGDPMEVIGVTRSGEGCPCIAIRTPGALAGEVVMHRTNNTLGLRLPE